MDGRGGGVRRWVGWVRTGLGSCYNPCNSSNSSLALPCTVAFVRRPNKDCELWKTLVTLGGGAAPPSTSRDGPFFGWRLRASTGRTGFFLITGHYFGVIRDRRTPLTVRAPVLSPSCGLNCPCCLEDKDKGSGSCSTCETLHIHTRPCLVSGLPAHRRPTPTQPVVPGTAGHPADRGKVGPLVDAALAAGNRAALLNILDLECHFGTTSPTPPCTEVGRSS